MQTLWAWWWQEEEGTDDPVLVVSIIYHKIHLAGTTLCKINGVNKNLNMVDARVAFGWSGSRAAELFQLHLIMLYTDLFGL